MATSRDTDDPFFSLSEDLFLVMELDGTVRRANPAVGRFLGRTEGELVGVSAFGYVHPDDAVFTAEQVERLLAGASRRASFENRWRNGAGAWRVLLWSVHLYGDDLMLAIGKDVTDRALAEARLAEAEDRYRVTVEGMETGVILQDASTRILLVNETAQQLLGRPAEELVGRTAYDLIWQPVREDRSPFPAEELAGPTALRTGGPARVVYGLERPDGGCTWLSVTARPLAAPGAGSPHGLVLSLHDVTRLKETELALRDNQQLLQAIIDNSPVAIFAKDAEGRYLFVSRCVEELTRIPPADFLGRTDAELLDPELAELYEAHDREVRESGVARTFDERILRPEGEGTSMAVKFPLFDAEGRVTGVCGISTDITDRLDAAEERRALEERLRQVERLESIGMLAGGVAHDFNNLLSIILNYLAFMGDALPPDSQIGEDLEQVREAAEQAADLTRQLLLFGRRELTPPTVLDVAAVIGATEGLLRRTLGASFALETRIAVDVWPVEGVRAELEQVLVNLVVNARDAMPQGGRVLVEAENEEVAEEGGRDGTAVAPGRYVRLAVRDTGTGMAAEVARRAFEPFYTTKPRGVGSGLGVATVWGIAARAGGTAHVDSRPGEGATISVLLPATPRVVPREGDDDRAASSAAPAAPPGAIIVAEDEPAVREMIRRILCERGYEVLCAASGPEALDLARDHPGPLGLVLTDVVMPGLTGRDLVSRLSVERPDLPAIYMSGYADDLLSSSGVGREAEFLAKPFDRAALLAAVDRALAGGPAAA